MESSSLDYLASSLSLYKTLKPMNHAKESAALAQVLPYGKASSSDYTKGLLVTFI